VEEASSELNSLLQEGGREDAEEHDAAAAEAAARLLEATPPADVDAVALRVVARWRAFVVERQTCPLLDLLLRHPDFFAKEVLERLHPVDRTMLAHVGRPWLAAVMSSGLLRVHNRGWARICFRELCLSAERLAWAKANGCPWRAVDMLRWAGT